MLSPTRSAVLVALVVLIAGCGSAPAPTGDDGGGANTPTLEYPAGTNESGIVDQETVVSTHDSILSNQSYAITAIQRVGDAEQRVTIRSNPDEMRATATAAGAGQLSGTELYITESQVYIKRGTGEDVQYAVQQPTVNFSTQHRRQMGVGYVVGVLDAGQFEPVGQTTINGTPVWEFQLAEYSGSQALPANVTNSSATVMIDGDGVIRAADVSVTASGSQGTNIDIKYRVDQIGGVSVSEPSWLSEAKAQTNASA